MGQKIENTEEARAYFQQHTRANRQVINGVLKNAIVSDDGHIFINHEDPFTLKKSLEADKVKVFQVAPVKGDIFVEIKKEPAIPAVPPKV
jgi:hypothetical protein